MELRRRRSNDGHTHEVSEVRGAALFEDWLRLLNRVRDLEERVGNLEVTFADHREDHPVEPHLHPEGPTWRGQEVT